MKKLALMLVFGVSLCGCKKNANDQANPNQDQPSSQAGGRLEVMTSSTVTTEAALKAAVANAKPGDVIQISGTIKLTSTLECVANGTASSKISMTGGVLDCSGLSSGWGRKS